MNVGDRVKLVSMKEIEEAAKTVRNVLPWAWRDFTVYVPDVGVGSIGVVRRVLDD